MSDRHEDDSAKESPIREAARRALRARYAMRKEFPSPSPEAKQALAVELSTYRDVLSNHMEEDALQVPWDKRPVNVDEIDRYLEATIQVGAGSDWLGRSESESVPLVYRIPPRDLIAIAKELDAIAKELGKWEDVESGAELYHVKKDPEDYGDPQTDGITKPQ